MLLIFILLDLCLLQTQRRPWSFACKTFLCQDTPFPDSVILSLSLLVPLPYEPLTIPSLSVQSLQIHLSGFKKKKRESICFKLDLHVSCFFRTSKNCLCAVESLFSLDYSYSPAASPSTALPPLLSSSLRLSSFLSALHFIIPLSSLSQRPCLHRRLSPLISVPPPHINILQPLILPVNRVTLQSAIATLPPDSAAVSPTGPLLWVNMTHASIILLSFCHYYTLEPLSVSPALSAPRSSTSSLCLPLSLIPRFVLLSSFHLSADDKYLHHSSAVSLESGVSFPLCRPSCHLSFPLEYELALSRRPPLSPSFYFPQTE